MPELHTRPAEAADLSILSQFWYEKAVVVRQLERHAHLDADARGEWERQAAAWLEDDDIALLTAEADNAICGYLIACIRSGLPGLHPGGLGFITEIALDPHQYHGGAARELVAAALRWFDTRGIRSVVACAPRSSAVDQAFWRAYGAAKWMEWLWIRS